ncbi:hypothetical protein [Microbacterium sp. NPDC064584]|uniref:hypothetical protein n=1 Tax=Microbacterium sp. NPDC064584 TaxID=3155817 RepID=UPI003425E80A
MITLYTVTLTVACCVAVALVIVSERRARSTDGPWASASTLSVLAASSATLSTLAYAMSGPDDEHLIPLLIGDVSMPLSIGLILAAVRVAGGMPRTWLILSSTVSVAVGATTLLLSPQTGQAVKLVALALLSFLTVFSCVRGKLPDLGAWLVGGTLTAYGAYCLVRFGAPLLRVQLHPYVEIGLSRSVATIVAAVAVGMVAWGMIVIIRRAQGPDPTAIVSNETLTNWIEALLAQRSVVLAITVTVPALPLHRAAFGRAWAQAIATAVTRASADVLPTGSVIGRAAPGALVALQFGTNFDLAAIRATLQETYEKLLPAPAPTDPPDLEVAQLNITATSDVRRFARHARSAARRVLNSQGV